MPNPKTLEEVIDNHPAFDTKGLAKKIRKFYRGKIKKRYIGKNISKGLKDRFEGYNACREDFFKIIGE